jgi:hypothetical protein
MLLQPNIRDCALLSACHLDNSGHLFATTRGAGAERCATYVTRDCKQVSSVHVVKVQDGNQTSNTCTGMPVDFFAPSEPAPDTPDALTQSRNSTTSTS